MCRTKGVNSVYCTLSSQVPTVRHDWSIPVPKTLFPPPQKKKKPHPAWVTLGCFPVQISPVSASFLDKSHQFVNLLLYKLYRLMHLFMHIMIMLVYCSFTYQASLRIFQLQTIPTCVCFSTSHNSVCILLIQISLIHVSFIYN